MSDCKLEDSKYLLEMSILPKHVDIVEKHQRSKRTMLLTAVVSHLARLESTHLKLDINVELPDECCRFEDVINVFDFEIIRIYPPAE